MKKKTHKTKKNSLKIFFDMSRKNSSAKFNAQSATSNEHVHNL